MKNFSFENEILYFFGELKFDIIKSDLKSLRKIKPKILDFSKLEKIDYASAIFIEKYFNKAKFTKLNEKNSQIFTLIKEQNSINLKIPEIKKENLIENLGKFLLEFKKDWIYFCEFLGKFLYFFVLSLLNPLKIRFKELSNNINDAGIKAIFIVCLTSFLIGIVLAYQGASMLEQFGASVFVVDIMGILTLREVGPLIAAIVVAGRSASSFTAQIGVMKITEEIDAMKTMGFEPFRFIVLPKVLALIISMPLIVFFANGISIIGQMIVCEFYLDMPFIDYMDRFRENVELRHFWVGLFKTPFFGVAIGLISCMRGFEISSSTSSVGIFTTKSVVNAIFWIIALDAGFSVIYTELGL